MSSKQSKAKAGQQSSRPEAAEDHLTFPVKLVSIYDIPWAQCSFSQQTYSLCMKLLNFAVPTICNAGARNQLDDVQNPKLIKALMLLVEVAALNGNISCLKYYLSPEKEAELATYVQIITSRFLAECAKTTGKILKNPRPATLTLQFLARYLAREYQAQANMSRDVDPVDIDLDNNLRLVKLLNTTRTVQLKSKSAMKKYEQYLKELDPETSLSMSMLQSLTSSSGMKSIECALVVQQTETTKERFKVEVPLLRDGVQYLNRIISPPDTDCPAYRMLSNIFPLADQFKLLNQAYKRIIGDVSSPLAPDDPVHAIWWEATGLYMKILKLYLKSATALKPVDYYSRATFTRLILQAKLSGLCKTISYTDIENLSNKMAKLAAACDTWAPPMWSLEFEAERKLVTMDILPFLKELNPSSYETATIDVFGTPGVLDHYTDDTFFDRLYGGSVERTCTACGKTAPDMIMCSLCQSVFYCNRSCKQNHCATHTKQACQTLNAQKLLEGLELGTAKVEFFVKGENVENGDTSWFKYKF